MAPSTRWQQRKPSKQQAEGKLAANTSQYKNAPTSRTHDPTNLNMTLRHFDFKSLPLAARLRIFHFLGFPTDESFRSFTDKTRKTTMSFRELYKVDLNFKGKLSVPWNVSPTLKHWRSFH
jgi:hypothetical protein